ncbi:MAG: YadA C-terminal domain-containing protein, partial [Pseudomonadota bacterium]
TARQVSNSVQSGTLYYVTVDDNGNIGVSSNAATTGAPITAPSDPEPVSPPITAQAAAAAGSDSSALATAPSQSQPSGDGGQITNSAVGESGASATQELAQVSNERELVTQEGEPQVVMLDENQNIAEPPTEFDTSAGTRQASTASSSPVVNVSPANVQTLAQVSTAQFDQLTGRVGVLEGRVEAIEGQVSTLFDLTSTINRDAQRGIASIAAQANPHFPSEAGKTSYATNVATYRGEVGISAGLMHRFEGDFAITAGVTYAGGNSTSVRAGIAGEF